MYYQSRFGITKIAHGHADPLFHKIILKYIEGLDFYCRYYFKGLPSWNWYYPFHYTPLLADVHFYIQSNKLNLAIPKSEPFDPFEALMFMLPTGSFGLLPKAVSQRLEDE